MVLIEIQRHRQVWDQNRTLGERTRRSLAAQTLVAQHNLPHCNWKPRKNKPWWPQGLPGICKDSVHASHHQPLLIKVWKSVAVKIWDHFDSHAPHIIQSIHSVLVKFLATRQQVWSKMPRPSIPEDKINLRLILVSGKTKDYLFRPSDSAGEIAQYVFDNWPIDWNEEAVSSAEILRMIYQGRFLHGNVTLAALGLPTGKTTVMHLVPRESLPEPNSQDDESKKKGRTSGCCTCSIL